MNLYAGTSGYAYKPWKGAFYPPELPAEEMLRFYSGQFRAVEINNTFYRMPKPAVLESWASTVPSEFKFALKAPQRITHTRRLLTGDNSVGYFLKVAGSLRERLGPVLFQLPPHLHKDLPRLREFLSSLPQPCRAAFEFRHQSWFDPEVYNLLSVSGAALCIADADNDLDVPFLSTTNWGYLRLRRPGYTDLELQAWLEQVLDQRWLDAFVFFKHEDTAQGPALARRFMEFAEARVAAQSKSEFASSSRKGLL